MQDSIYSGEYRRKLVSPQKAVESIRDGQSVVVGLVNGEPPALLEAIAARAKSGDLKSLNAYMALPMAHLKRTLLDVELMDVIRAHTWFVSAVDRPLVRVGLNYYIPNYLHQLPRSDPGVHGNRPGRDHRLSDGQGRVFQLRDGQRLHLDGRPLQPQD